ncbi:MAG: hypothetical protein M3Z05_02215 [Gemmatimonadota bacterium]|nr:hypothetical protein [Gemmatimonadota bacterium]
MLRHSILIAMLAFSVLASRLSAQSERSPLSADVAVGLSYGQGGGMRDARTGLAASGVIARALRPAHVGRPVVALIGSTQGPISGGDVCLLTPGSGGCVPNYPRIESLGLLGGWTLGQGNDGAAARVLLGPAVFHSQDGGSTGGAQGRVDFATPALIHIALLAWGQGSVLPRLRGETYRLGAIGLGVRVR